MESKEELQSKAVSILLPLTKDRAILEALQEFVITLRWNDEKNMGEVIFDDR